MTRKSISADDRLPLDLRNEPGVELREVRRVNVPVEPTVFDPRPNVQERPATLDVFVRDMNRRAAEKRRGQG